MRNACAATGVMLAGSTAMVMFALPAQAGTTARADVPASSLIVDNGSAKSVTLNCDGLGTNTHPYAAEACAALEQADGDIAQIPGLDGYGCLGVYLPVTIGVSGTWHGRPLEYREVASNVGCGRISHQQVFFY
jgi:subtilisin inhibitor-like